MRGMDYIVKRTAFALMTVFVAITLNFVLFRALPGDAVTGLRCRTCTIQFKNEVRQQFGLDKSKWEQYVIYLKQLARGNLGRSVTDYRPVTTDLWGPLKNTLPMLFLGTIFSIVFGILSGVISAWRRGTGVDRVSLWSSLGFYSMPTQWLGMMVVLYIAIPFGLPTSGLSDPTLGLITPASTFAVVWDRFQHMVLPALTLGLVLYGEYTLIVRSSMLETLGEDYVLTARAKGLRNWAIVWKHGLRNAMLPVVTLIALSFGYIVGGAILVEDVFSYPGIGLATVDAVTSRDYPVLQGAFLLLTVSVIFCNYVADLLYFKLDPRVTT
ncbi:MAG TPA: ABC transporter permease [Gaiellales bacterium]|nr:ABC transporter permease [Gaiellales bacterium]